MDNKIVYKIGLMMMILLLLIIILVVGVIIHQGTMMIGIG